MTVTGPFSVTPAAGDRIATPVGAGELSTAKVTVELFTSPAALATSARKLWLPPSVTVAEFHGVVNGASVSSAPTLLPST